MLTVSAKPSIEIAEESSERTPREVITVIAPKASGISAATGERKTSSRTSSRIGRAISSLRWVAWIDSSWIARERVAKPGLRRLDRRRHLFLEDLVEFVDRVADRVAGRRRGSRPGPGPCSAPAAGCRLCLCPRARRSSLSGRWRAARGPVSGPALRSPSGGPWRRIAKGAESPKYCAQHLVGAVRVRARDVERGRVELALDVAADPAEAEDQREGDHQDRPRPPKRQRQPTLTGAGSLALLSPTHVARKVRRGVSVFLTPR